MEPVSLLLLIGGIFGSGMITKAGEDTFDKLRGVIQKRLQGTATGRALEAGEEPDPAQAVIDVQAIDIDDELKELIAKTESLLAENEDLREQVKQLMEQQPQAITKTIQGINVEAGGVVNNPTFNF